MSNSPVPRPPDQWRDSMHPVNHSPVAAALSVLGDDVPAGWEKTRTAFRSAEWTLTCRTSLHVLRQNRDLAAASLADAEQRMALKPGSLTLQEFVGNCQAIFDVADAVLSAALTTCNGSNPMTIAAQRQQRAILLRQAREQHNLHAIRREPTPQEEIDRLTDLLDTVAADERAAEVEMKEIATLQSAANAAKGKAIDVLADALDKMILSAGRKIASLLTPRQVAIAREYPELAAPEILATWQRAQNLAAISTGLDGAGVDVDQTVGRALTGEQHEVLAKILFRATRHLFGEARGRRRT